MKIIQNTSDRFVIVERPWFLASAVTLFTVAVVYGLVTTWTEMELAERALLVGFSIALPLVAHHSIHWVRAEFDRTTGRIDISRLGFLHDRRRSYSLRYLKRTRVEEHNNEGVTWRAVLVFDEAMLTEMDPVLRERLEKRKARGFRQAAPHEAPLTAYSSSTSDAKTVAKALNEWLGAPA